MRNGEKEQRESRRLRFKCTTVRGQRQVNEGRGNNTEAAAFRDAYSLSD